MHYKKRKIEETIINRRECDTSVYLDILVEYGNKRIIIGKVSGEGRRQQGHILFIVLQDGGWW